MVDRAALARAAAALNRERAILLRAAPPPGAGADVARATAGVELRGGPPDLVSVVLNANGFNNLLEQIAFLRPRPSASSRAMITITRRAKAQADAAAAPTRQARGR